MPLTPVFMEKATGDQLAPQLEQQHGGVTQDAQLSGYVESVGRTLALRMSRKDIPVGFRVLESRDIVNAFALGNGNVYITRGLLDLLDDEAELAEILGHELGHVDRRHIAASIDQALGTGLLLAAAEAVYLSRKGGTLTDRQQELVDAASALVPQLILNGFSRSHEFEADATGLALMSGAGYDPSAAIRVFQRFQKLEGPKKEGIEIFFRSHPWAADRVAEIRRLIEKKSLPSGRTERERYQEFVKGIRPADADSDSGIPVPLIAGAAAVLAVGVAAIALS